MYWVITSLINMKLRLLLLIGMLWLGGCSYIDSLIGEEEEIIDPPAVLVEFQPSVEVKKIWSKNTGDGTDDQYLLLAPIIASQKIYIASTDMKVMAIEAANGKNIWNRKLDI